MAGLPEGDIFMMKQKVLIIFIIFTALLPILIDVFLIDTQEYSILWALYLLPAIGVIILFPSWKVTITVAFTVSVIQIGVDIFEEGIFQLDLRVVLLAILVEWSILFTLSYFTIEQQKLYKEVQELTLQDQLTGAYNRRYFDLYMEKAIPYSKETGTTFHLMILDIDRFKKINDTYGHTFGDEVLKNIAAIISKNISGADGFVRMGGEEFAILVPGTTTEECLSAAECIRKSVEISSINYQGEKVTVTSSIGLVEYKGESIEELMDKADQALYKSKNNGRNKVTLM